MAKKLKRPVGHPYTNPAAARAKLHELDIAMKETIKAHAAFQKQCIADGLLNRVKVGETPVKAHMRGKFENVWADQAPVTIIEGVCVEKKTAELQNQQGGQCPPRKGLKCKRIL